MSHRSLFWPLALIAVVATTLIVIFASSPAELGLATVAAAIDCPTEIANPAYPDCIKTQTAEQQAATSTPDYSGIIRGCPTEGPAFIPPYPPYADCLQTRTAILAQTGQAGASSTPTTAPAQSQNQPTATLTPTATATATITQTAIQGAQLTPTQQSTPSATRTAAPTATAEELEIDDSAIECIPGETIVIEGSTEPGATLLVTFGDRPVGGGFSRDDGSYRIRLHIGNERPGTYPVVVEERNTATTIQELLCRVPALTPTPTIPLVP